VRRCYAEQCWFRTRFAAQSSLYCVNKPWAKSGEWAQGLEPLLGQLPNRLTSPPPFKVFSRLINSIEKFVEILSELGLKALENWRIRV